ncbi:MAG: peptidase domain-containing ABC transporter [Phenylobacterium sp.]|nr:MAG: peptidase domain-containing ABC transporter [Phenylobacterium sp.]
MILQSEAAECGVACLAMVAGFYGQHYGLGELRRRFSASLKGTTLKAVMDMADGLGFAARPVRLELRALSQLKCPAILHWDLRHYVVLRAVRGKTLWIHDPARGARTLTFDEASRSFTGVALEFTPTPAFAPKKSAEKARLGDLFSRARGVLPSVVQLFLLAMALQVIALFSPMLNQMVIDDVLTKGDADLLGALALGMVGLLVINQGVSLLRGFIDLYMGTQLSYQMQSNLLRHVLRLPVSWFEKRHLGDMLSRFNSLAPAQSVFTTSISSVLLNSVMALLAVAMMCVYSELLSAIEFGSIVLLFGVRLLTFPWYRERQIEGLHLAARVQSTFLETLRGARAFKVFGRERERISLWQNEQSAQINNTVVMRRASLWGGLALGLLSGLQTIVVWFIGARLVIDGHLTLGMLVAFQSFTAQFTGAAASLVGQYFTWKSLGIHLERLADITHAEPEPTIDEPVVSGRRFDGGLAVRDLSFRYADHEPWVLKDINLNVAPGEFVCLVGPSGQGKTTLLKVMLGFYDPQEGQVLVDGAPLRAFGVRTFRDRIGVVMQDDQLFGGTIADNIAFFEPDLDMEKVETAAKAAQVHSDIVNLPMGYLTLVGDMGSVLSGGQKQRIFLARALYRDPKVLFLDEGTANLDPENERRVMEVLQGLDITRIFVAHREAAVAGADRVIAVRDKRAFEVLSGGMTARAPSPVG